MQIYGIKLVIQTITRYKQFKELFVKHIFINIKRHEKKQKPRLQCQTQGLRIKYMNILKNS